MNRLKQTLYLLAVAIVAAGCGRAEGNMASRGETVTINRSWPAASIRELQVAEVDGNVSIVAAPGDQITLVATAEGDLDRKKGVENEGLFKTALEGDTLSIGRKERRTSISIPFVYEAPRVRIHYQLQVPPSVSLQLTTVNGKIATKGSDADTKVVSVNGTIDIEATGNRELSATTVNGRVRAKFSQSFQGAQFKTVNGGVEATLPQTASFAVDLSQVNGDFEASFPLSIHSNPGSRRVSGEVNGGKHELKIVTVNGDVELSRTGGTS